MIGNLLYTLQKGIRYFKHYGLREFLIRLREKGEPENISYEEYVRAHRTTEKELERQNKECSRWENAPLFVCVVSDGYGNEARKQLECQTYPKWKVCTGASLQDTLKKAIEEIYSDINRAYFLFLEDGDALEPSALYEAAHAILFPEKTRQSGLHWETVKTPDVIYTDEDEMDVDGNLRNPQMKPDFSADMLEEVCYIKHLLIVSGKLVKRVLAEWDKPVLAKKDCTLEEFIYCCVKNTKNIFHIPKVLYHSGHTKETVSDKKYKENLKKNYTGNSLVSIIIPNKDQKESLEKCLESIVKSSYHNYEVIIVENNSSSLDIFSFYDIIKRQHNVRVVTWNVHGQFNYAAINNYGASFAQGDYLVFLNNDIELITAEWLEKMLADCQRDEVAAVGAKLYYPDNTVQHAGIVIGIGGHARGVAANMCVGLPGNESGYMDRASIRQNMSAVTAACMMMKKQVFDEVGGFSEDLAVAFNDVDLCLKARKAGYLIVYDPYVEAYHYESKSRGQEDTEEKVRRFQSEIEYMRTMWEDILKEGDPYYNPNLTRYRTDYSLSGDK